MPGNDPVGIINQNGIAKSKTRNAIGDLPDLLERVGWLAMTTTARIPNVLTSNRTKNSDDIVGKPS